MINQPIAAIFFGGNLSAPTKQEMLDNLETAINTRLTGGAVQSYAIGDRNLQYCTLSDLIALRDKLKKEIAAGSGFDTRTHVSFKDPS